MLASKRIRMMRFRLGLMSTIDSPFLRFEPPDLRHGEVVGPPDFVGIGVQKAGTSWWFNLIIQHPDVFHRPTTEVSKERHYLSHCSLDDFGPAECEGYARWFPRPATKITGEWTPDYFYYAWLPEMLRQAAPNARILLMLRDPVDRMISGLAHLARIDEGHLPRENLLQEAFDRGLYARQLQRWLQHFDASRILVQQYEACVANPDAEMSRTLSFLGVSPKLELRQPQQIVNPTRVEKEVVSETVRKRYAHLYRDDLDELLKMVPDLNPRVWPSLAVD